MNNVILSVAKDLATSKSFYHYTNLEILRFTQDDKQQPNHKQLRLGRFDRLPSHYKNK